MNSLITNISSLQVASALGLAWIVIVFISFVAIVVTYFAPNRIVKEKDNDEK
jgi:cbb3-type cytochrome oxidase subunit 3